MGETNGKNGKSIISPKSGGVEYPILGSCTFRSGVKSGSGG
jgi:hypothetical protein